MQRKNGKKQNALGFNEYRKVASSRPVYYSILDPLAQRSQYISIKFLLHKQSEDLKMCDFTVYIKTKLIFHKLFHPNVLGPSFDYDVLSKLFYRAFNADYTKSFV